jgi:RimJ/RimL family protein N-acetyltransferase
VASTYQCLHEPIKRSDGHSIVSLRQADLLSIMRWRNDQIDILRQKAPLTERDQERYYRDAIVPSFHATQPPIVLASYLLNDECIGYGGLTNIDWSARRAELSFLVATSRSRVIDQYRRDFNTFIELVKILAFDRLQLRRLFTETYDVRPYHIDTLESAGFKLEGRLRDHYMIAGKAVDALFHGLLREEPDARL